MMSYEDKILWSKELADRVKTDYDPYAVIVGFTSGSDSNIALKLATMFFKVDAAFTCDTTIGAIETLQTCENVAKGYGLKHICQAPRYNGVDNNKDTYTEIVKQHGFPGQTDTAHGWMYKWLKDHTISNIVSQFRQRKRNRRIVIISGARRHESVRRMGTSQDITVDGNNIWVNICNDWTDSDCQAFTHEYNLDKLRSPISKSMGLSGECFCGCFAGEGELSLLKIFSPSTWEKINWIANWLIENTDMLWGWESGPPKKRELDRIKKLELLSRQMTIHFSPKMLFCSTCMNNQPKET